MHPEKEYYPVVSEYINNKFNCISTGVTKGYLALGLVDVVGAYETSSEFLNDLEVIVAEIKTNTFSFGKSIGQALGYTIYGERCYLAVTFEGKETFSKEQGYIADHLGVGLIRIPVDSSNKPLKFKIETILTSKKHDPIHSQKQKILHGIGITKCSLCGVYGNKKDMHQLKRDAYRPALFTNIDYRKIFLCDGCYLSVISKDERLKREAQLETTRKAVRTRKHRKRAKKAVQTRKEREMVGKEEE